MTSGNFKQFDKQIEKSLNMTKQKKIQRMLDNATSIEIDGIELTHWRMDEIQDCDNDDIVFEGFAETEDGDYHWSIPAWGFGEIAEAEGNRIFCKNDLGEECEILCFKKTPYSGE